MTEIYTPITTAKESNQPMITSLEVAEMVGKQHRNVLQDIRKIGNELDLLNVQQVGYFTESCYKAGNGQQQPMFLLTKQGCELYGNRMTGIDGTAFAIKYIDRFNAMEEVLQQPKQPALPTSYKEALQHLLIAVEEKEAVQKELAIVAPKAEALDVLTGNTDKLYTITQIATNYGMSGIKMNSLLNQLGVQYYRSGNWKLYAKYEGKGYTVTPTGQANNGHTYKSMKWTNKGEYFLYNLLKEHGYTSTTYDLMFQEQDNL